MKQFNHYLFSFILLAVIFSSCNKDAAVKPAKIATVSDAAFTIAAVTASGTIIYSGHIAPNAAIGNIGDFYINLTNTAFYGPKTATGWGTPIFFKGATGTPGSIIHSDIIPPTAAIGVNGDFFLDKATGMLYGPKTAAGWGTPISLKGPSGATNVIYSDWITPSKYTKDTIFSVYHFYADIAASKITRAILDSGIVIVYGKLIGYTPLIWPTTQVSALPIVVTYQTGSSIVYNDTWASLITLGNVRIQFTNDQNLYNSISNAHKFRYVIIPGGVHTTGAANIRDYHKIQQMYHIPD